ncbi:hypothetical protein HanXRQr2_Chr09g0377361 [Helianthus annuus]|uniref:Uncharacterized protein n=1 Tax=Helianthus annuus TaxID=4232 RepID=A0A9K3I3U6_HELAN|nr:hypothetical protein HanXRQr2_Chr09g0377361 [Helianthus annuus]KAJ0525236.1 hypothetical protein HanHA300_Chr09g0309731 [Helianthus annuus]KAJ0533291.1 hypothetical protein HanIR_Chr09g0406741 [Helianthus annuus]KAJ0710704.1 hypothetical protein HanOQP8_Chr09g0315441 [Helianthus annuus]KAJ0892257.1 hypothetical protein HanPSC8_Chr09g0363771 [Helianthus annuus]
MFIVGGKDDQSYELAVIVVVVTDRRIRVLKQGGSANGASCFNHIGWENVFNYSVSFYRLKILVLGGCCNFTGRHADGDGSLSVEDFNLELENQTREKVKLGTKDDQRYN